MKSVDLIERIGWVEWLTKTNFSFLVGASHPHEMIEKMESERYSAYAINDFDGVYGLARSYIEHQKIHATARLLYGAEIKMQPADDLPILLTDRITLIAKNKKGYQQLNQCLQMAKQRENSKQTYLSWEGLAQLNTKDLICLQPMRGSIRKGEQHQSYPIAKEIFAGNYYLVVSRHLHPSEDLWIREQLQAAKKFHIPYLYSGDCFFHRPQQKSLHDTLCSIRQNQTLSQASSHFFPNAQRFPQKLASLAQLYAPIGNFARCLERSQALLQEIDFSFSELSYHYPKEMLPQGFTAQSYLEHLVWQNAPHRFGNPIPCSLRELLRKELDCIEHLGFADYFLTVWDIVSWAREQKILCQGRGSAANSSVCYVLGITAVNPRHFDLLFERFMSKERGDPPDIDVDFEHERREEVIQYIYRRYGRERAAMVANVICFRRKGALRAVGKALGVDVNLIEQAAQLDRSRLFRGKSSSDLLACIKTKNPQSFKRDTPINLSGGYFSETKNSHSLLEHWQQLTEQLIGFPRHLGLHSGGFIIAEHRLDELCPIENASMPGRSCIQWCKEDIEALHFFKIDILALGMLTALRKSFHAIETYYQRKLDLYHLPDDDPATYQMIQKADTVGVFQIESRAQMSMLPRLKPRCFYDLVIEIAIIRPGPIQGGIVHPFLRRRQGLEPIDFPCESLRPILARSLGVILFQEQAMRIAMELGDFSGEEANLLRRNIGAWNMPGHQQNLSPLLQKLKQGMQKKKLPNTFIEQMLAQMRGFAEYGFPESHAISFAHLAYASSFIKCHYPAVFFCSLLNSQPMGFYSPHSLIRAAQRDGCCIYPIDLQCSHIEHRLEPIENQQQPAYAIRLGLRMLHSLSQQGAEKIVAARKQGAFLSLEDFIQRCPLYRDDFTALASADLFRIFSLSRIEAFWLASALPLKPWIDTPESKISFARESLQESLTRDFHATGTSLICHPCTALRQDSWPFAVPLQRIRSSQDFSQICHNQVFYGFGMLVVKQSPPSAKAMVFLSLEDEYGFINLVLSPQIYQQYYEYIEQNAFVCFQGKMQKQGEGHSIWVKKLYPPTRLQNLLDLDEQRSKREESKHKLKNLYDKIRRIRTTEASPLLPPRNYR